MMVVLGNALKQEMSGSVQFYKIPSEAVPLGLINMGWSSVLMTGRLWVQIPGLPKSWTHGLCAWFGLSHFGQYESL